MPVVHISSSMSEMRSGHRPQRIHTTRTVSAQHTHTPYWSRCSCSAMGEGHVLRDTHGDSGPYRIGDRPGQRPLPTHRPDRSSK